MLVITDVKYEVLKDPSQNQYVIYDTRWSQTPLVVPQDPRTGCYTRGTVMVVPRTYYFTLPRQAVETDSRVQALREAGLSIDDVINDNIDQLVKCSIKVGVAGSKDNNVVLAILGLLQETADSYSEHLATANRAVSQCVEHSASLRSANTRMRDCVEHILCASFWQRLKWLFTGATV